MTRRTTGSPEKPTSGKTSTPQVHPTETHATPAGDRVRIDVGIAPLVRTLWAVDLCTLGCCEDVGASIYGGGWLYPPQRRVRYAAFWDGFAWLKMPVEDAERLMAVAGPIVAGRGWECSSPIVSSGGRLPIANLYFPARQINELTHLLERDR